VPLRFPNPGSDIARLVNSYRLIHRAAHYRDAYVFDLDFMTEVMTEHFQASSRGAVGSTARLRSADQDRSRDPLYNQLKMYSEVYRMLGWLRPAKKRLEFSTTILGDLIAEDFADRPDLVHGLTRQCFMGMTFPNPATNNVGVTNLRPFRWLLMLAAELGGAVTRHEMILCLLAVVDDLAPSAFEDAADCVRAARGGSRRHLDNAVAAYAKASKIQVNTLENYTRLPVGVLKSAQLGWAESQRVAHLYDKPVSALLLTGLGHSDAEWLRTAVDIREDQLAQFGLDERAHFANYGYYAMLLRLEQDVSADLMVAQAGCTGILEALNVTSPLLLLYSPVQQADDKVLERASNVE
jgi:hypothetical protein